ncbi:MAG: GMC family oxidoreductase [Oscillatoriophycideae cyanobacterium NC_groundwater_1537_Pr4_S-0.65um_50_18]|nr:GMC family oxidoreductase [Oscillatoriophycideae cyanobacterium NC_groundwater_1537_Pr4_S-0.65um_50_18]
MTDNHYDVAIIGTGAGGGTVAHRLASSGKKILVLERGTFLPREKANWDAAQVFKQERYFNTETWSDKDGQSLRPAAGYWVGGNTKFYGGTLFRMREQEFNAVVHKGGISPEWCLKYNDFEPYYSQAEQLYQVHGQRGLDPVEPWSNNEYPFPAISHEPRIQAVHNDLKDQGLHPFYLPMAIKLNEAQQFLSECIRCETCDGHPCLAHAKADAEVMVVRPAMQQTHVTLLTEAKVTRLHTSTSGREITTIETEVAGEIMQFQADIVIVACGAINSAALLLRSANDAHPNGLANRSDQVGRNFMKHNCGVVIGLMQPENLTVFQKTLGINDFYWGEPDFPYPMGQIQLSGKVNQEMLMNDVPLKTTGVDAETAARHSVDWWLMGEDLPDPNNRVRIKGDKIHLDYTENNTEAFNRLIDRWIEVLKSIDIDKGFMKQSLYYRANFPLKWVAHQCGTCRFGFDPDTSVLDVNCRAHEIDNLYVVDSSFFASNTGSNPTLTVVANALRVSDHLLGRLK